MRPGGVVLLVGPLLAMRRHPRQAARRRRSPPGPSR
jgi:hypothetical protein